MIALNQISYTYRHGAEALINASGKIDPGIHLLLGENGAGKTTLLHVIAGLLYPTKGNCLINGRNVRDRQPSTLQKLFLLTDDVEFQGRTVNEISDIHGCFYPRFSKELLVENLGEFGMTGNEPLTKMSLGTRRKALIAYVLSLRVEVLMLDEPANGLDINAKKTLRRMLSRCTDDEQIVIVSTHTVWDLKDLFDGLMVISRGRLLVNRPTWEIAEVLTFTADNLPIINALYQEQDTGLFRGIIANESGEPSTEVDFNLLYSALMSPACDRIISILSQNNDYGTGNLTK